MEWKIPLSDIDLGNEEIEEVTRILRSKWLSMGPMTIKFEEEFAQYIGSKHAFAVTNGTAALHIACVVSGIGPGDEVIVPSLSFVATANAVLYTGANIVFADITSFDNFNISPRDIANKITKKTRAIIPVHYGGYPCDMDAILEIAEKNDLKIIEDAAHAPGAEYGERKVGTIGNIGCFSFFANKNITTGEGGMIVTNDDSIAKKIKTIRSHGMTSLTWDRHRGHAYSYDVVETGYNYRISEIASAIGLVQLKKLERNNKMRENITKQYRKYLKDLSNLSVPFSDFEGRPSYHIFPILLSEVIARDEFMGFLKNKGIQTSIYYPPIHLFTNYRELFSFKEGLLPKTEFIGKHQVTLPLHPRMNSEDVEYIISSIRDALK
jgi:dTDP-4-amino-4,6-dideoxygalactose transaminase